jgi:DNA primase
MGPHARERLFSAPDENRERVDAGHWDEIERGITSEQFTMDVVLKRIARYGDLFAPVLKGKIKLPM